MKYVCSFCGKEFDKCSDCAKHIEEESKDNICRVEDIIQKPDHKVDDKTLSELESRYDNMTEDEKDKLESAQ